MKYCIAHIIQGEAGEFHTMVSNSLADEFSMSPISEKIPPHLTLKAPFEIEDDKNSIEEIKLVLQSFTKYLDAPLVHFKGFGSFDNRVLYLDASISKEAALLIHRFEEELHHIPWLSFARNDGGKNLHATLAYARSPEEFTLMMYSLKKFSPSIVQPFDNISLLRKEQEKWVVDTTYPLRLNN
jgi:2'-5' RNA ligase